MVPLPVTRTEKSAPAAPAPLTAALAASATAGEFFAAVTVPGHAEDGHGGMAIS
jgi:hypothetical protein